MKVTTDACIQGAWTPVTPMVKNVLDIGSGTGLLSLMLAQTNEYILIDAVELDVAAGKQAKDNFLKSPWASRLSLIEGDIRNFSSVYKYDLIITNPPFFNNSLKGNSIQKNTARHTDTLAYTDLLEAIERNLADEGYFSILLPYTEYQIFLNSAKTKNWHNNSLLTICHTEKAEPKRVIGIFSRKYYEQEINNLIIKEKSGSYTQTFIDLLQPYYLYL